MQLFSNHFAKAFFKLVLNCVTSTKRSYGTKKCALNNLLPTSHSYGTFYRDDVLNDLLKCLRKHNFQQIVDLNVLEAKNK